MDQREDLESVAPYSKLVAPIFAMHCVTYSEGRANAYVAEAHCRAKGTAGQVVDLVELLESTESLGSMADSNPSKGRIAAFRT